MPHSMKLALIFLLHNKTENLLKTFLVKHLRKLAMS